MEMEDSFNVRVDKVFGTLSSSSSSSKPHSISSLWSLTDEEIERQEWSRDSNSPDPEPKHFRPKPILQDIGAKKPIDSRSELEKPIDSSLELEKDLDELDDGDEEEEEAEEEVKEAGASSSSSVKPGKPDDYNDEEWEIKSSIGLDCTLDNEEEEDEYDKVADGEKDGNYLYMKEVNDYETEADAHREIPTSFKEAIRDPRANRMAAKLRIKEDAEAAKKRLEEDVEAADKINSLRVTEDDDDVRGNLKSILKRKETDSDSKSQKRVRFDSECKDTDDDDEGFEGTTKDDAAKVPDYIRNPSRYTHYTFDSSSDDIDEESNRKAYTDFVNLLKKSDSSESRSDDLKSVTFIPRRKSGDATLVVEDRMQSKQNRAVRIAAGEDDMEEDEPQEAAVRKDGSLRSGRQYRMKPSSEID